MAPASVETFTLAAVAALFVSLHRRQSATPEGSSAGAVGDIVAKHPRPPAFARIGCGAHALRHTFCTMLAARGVAVEVIRALADHVEVRTTQIYVDVPDERKADGIATLEQQAHPLAGITPGTRWPQLRAWPECSR